MIFKRALNQSRKTTEASTTKETGKTASARLYSIAGSLDGRVFRGSFDAAGTSYRFVYAPARAVVERGKFHLDGRLSATDSAGRERGRVNVRARLAGTQGGIGTAPVRSQILVGGVTTSTASTSNQQQQIAGERRSEPTPATAAARRLPETDSTGPLSFCGVMYFHLDPIDGASLGVAADLSRVQLNARLAPTDDRGRALHSLYSWLVEALAQNADRRVIESVTSELNKMFAAR
ncbi:MAG TPA: hypothetical protein VJQ56_05905 [Blastocatellia bacterium]|nr:hypothetical protein [Blastocatellia bacterium]